MPRSEITIRLRAREDYVPAESLVRIIQSTLSMLRSVDRMAGHPRGSSAQWKVSAASLQSPLSITLSSDEPHSDFVAREYLSALDSIEKSVEIPKERLSSFFLERAKEMVSVLNDGVAQISVLGVGTSVQPTQRVAANVDYLTGPAYEDYASFEGRIETLSVHGRTRFRIYDELTGQSVECRFSPERLKETLDLFTSRVAVAGEAKYNRIGKPISIRVEEIRKLVGGVSLDQLQDINITGGIPSERYIRNMRDAE